MRAKRTIAVITALLGLVLATAGTASASPGSWVPYGNNNPITGSSAKWVCGGSEVIAENMLAQVCAIRSGNGTGTAVQGAVIIRNNRSSLASASARVVMWETGGGTYDYWYCSSSGIAAHSWSVCFGASFGHAGKVYATGDAKNVALGYTGDI
ncbi:hypothetical protein ABZX92_42130 [Lentzea sp. NPDC006480]|uniref:hypothetical protein n=1 Tax=Lentzea sp. NPDC006480 TaxID=3157176 RepID=UPI0033BF537C